MSLLSALLWLSACSAAAAARPNVVVITLDAVRSDHLSVYGYGRPTTPAIDRLAREGTRFANAYSASPWTLPSLASLWTARYPEFHGAHRWRMRLDPRAATLAAAAREGGYRTAAFVRGLPADRAMGMTTGFETVEQGDHHGAQGLVASALRWLDAQKPEGKPFFVWVHAYETHFPFSCPDDYRERFGPGYVGPAHAEAIERDTERRGAFVRLFNEEPTTGKPDPELAELAAKVKADPNSVRHLVDHYDGCLRYADTQVEALILGLQRRGLWSDTIVVMTSDHGERLGQAHGEEKSRLSHGGDLYEDVLRVPLIIRHPRRGRGRVVESMVSLLDVAPTLAAAMQVAPPPSAQGLDLGPWLNGSPTQEPHPFIYASDFQGADWIRSLRKGRWKLLRLMSGPWRLFDLAQDPEERTDRLASQPAVFTDAAATLLEAIEGARASVAAGGEAVTLEY